MSKSKVFHINWLASTGSALGAVSSAVLLSTLGAAGTIFGAALGSLVITVGGSIYTQSLQKTKDRVVNVRGNGQRSTSSQSPGSTVVESSNAPPRSSEDPEELPKKSLPWKRIIGLSVGLFVAVMALILVFELSTGRPVSSYTGGSSDTKTGTTFSGLTSGSRDSDVPDAEKTDEEKTDAEQSKEEQPVEEEPAEEKPVEKDPVEEKPADPPQAADPPPAEAPPAEAPPAESDE